MSDFIFRYEVKKYPFVFTLGGKCIEAEYGLNLNGTVSVLNKQLSDGKKNSILGSARIKTPSVASLLVKFPNIPGEANYEVLDTDYETFAVVYTCSRFLGLFHGKVVWILSRVRFPPQSLLDHAFDVIRANGLSTSYLATTDQTDCPGEIPGKNYSFRN